MKVDPGASHLTSKLGELISASLSNRYTHSAYVLYSLSLVPQKVGAEGKPDINGGGDLHVYDLHCRRLTFGIDRGGGYELAW